MAERTDRQLRRAERAHRILDAAAELVQRYGYNKTTVDDLARQAGVAKGTLYLHWKTRDELFGALLRREQFRLARAFLNGVRASSERPTLRGLFRQAALGLSRHPLMRAAFTRDVEVVGKLVREQGQHPERKELFEVLLEYLSQRNMARSDLSPHAQAFLVRSVFLGFFMMASWTPEPMALPDEAMADLVADTVSAALDLGGRATAAETDSVTEEFLAHLEELVAREEAEFEAELL